MLKQITIRNGIKHHNKTYNIEQGLIAITGKNGSGKSLMLEFIRFALFGTKALRGVVEDYPKLEVDMEFEVKNVPYSVTRSTKNALLKRGEEELAIGTTAVNDKIKEIFGYELTIFDMANCALQSEVTALGKMKPTERKEAIDNVIGLKVIDEIIKELKEEAKTLKAKVEGIKEGVVEPVKPIKPENYRPSEEVIEDYKLKQQISIEMKSLGEVSKPKELVGKKNWVAYANKVVADTKTYSTYKYLLDNKPSLKLTQKQISDIKKGWENYVELPETPEFSTLQLDQMLKDYATISCFEALPEKSNYTKQKLNKMKNNWDNYNDWLKAVNEIEKARKVSCPECKHEFHLDIDEKTIKLAEKEIARPELVIREIDVELKKLEAWESFKGKKKPETPPLTLLEIKTALEAYKKLEEYKGKDVSKPKHSLSEVKEVESYNNAVAMTKDLEVNEEMSKLIEQMQKAERLEELKKVVLPKEDVDVLQQLSVDCKVYEDLLVKYEKQKDHYAKVIQQTKEMEEQEAELRVGAKALVQLKLDVKQYLLPSLSRVASHLVNVMSGGKFLTVQLDEHFNISVDGIKLNLLSGSECAIVNLALRIALGQVLTNKVFSVFMGDELDASMETERADEVADALGNLTNIFKQIIVVSHKDIAADGYISL